MGFVDDKSPDGEKVTDKTTAGSFVFEEEDSVPVERSKSIFCFDGDFLQVVLFAFAFMFNLGSFAVCSMAQTVILNSVNDEYFQGTPTMGYILLAITFTVQALTLFLGPSMISVVGPKSLIVAGSVCLCIDVACFIRPLTWSIYAGAAIAGFGAGSLWLLPAYFIRINSTHANMGRNTGIFWAIYQTSLVVGNLFYFFLLRGQSTIDDKTRTTLVVTLLVTGVIGTVFFCCLRHPWFGKQQRPQGTHLSTDEFVIDSPKEAIVGMVKFAMKKEMLILLPCFFHVGVEFAFWYNVYATSVGYTMNFGILRESLVGLTGVFAGIGQIGGGIILGLTGNWSHKNGRDPGMLSAMMIHYLCYFLIFLNLPSNSSLGPTYATGYLGLSKYIVKCPKSRFNMSVWQFFSPYLAMFCAVLLGYADAAWNTQLISHLGAVFPNSTVMAFGLFQFSSSFGNIFEFLCSSYINLPYQFLILTVFSLPAAFGFFHEEWKFSRRTAADARKSGVKPEVSVVEDPEPEKTKF